MAPKTSHCDLRTSAIASKQHPKCVASQEWRRCSVKKWPSLQLPSMRSASATRVLCGWTVVSAPDTHTECAASHTCCTLVSLPTCCYLVEAQSCPNPPKRGRGARLACSLFKERDQSQRTALKSFGSCTKCKGSTPASASLCLRLLIRLAVALWPRAAGMG